MKPVAHLFRLEVAREDIARFREIGLKNLTLSQKNEAGTLAMYVSPLQDKETVFYVFEVYQDKQAYQIHCSSPQFHYFTTEGVPLLINRQAYELNPIFLEETLPAGEWFQAKDFYLRLVQVDLASEHADDFYSIVISEMQESMKKEKGVLAMYALADRSVPHRSYFFEVYESRKAYLLHRDSPHFETYIRETADMVIDKKFIPLQNGLTISKGSLYYKA